MPTKTNIPADGIWFFFCFDDEIYDDNAIIKLIPMPVSIYITNSCE